MHQGTKIPGVSESSSAKPTHFMHHIADNADHNSRNLNDCNTIYWMSIICTVTLAVFSSFATPRLGDLSTEDIIRITEKERKIILSSRKSLKLMFIELNQPLNAFDPLTSAWVAKWLLNPWQLWWRGYMQVVNTGNHPGQVSTFFMPMIDLKSTDSVKKAMRRRNIFPVSHDTSLTLTSRYIGI